MSRRTAVFQVELAMNSMAGAKLGPDLMLNAAKAASKWGSQLEAAGFLVGPTGPTERVITTQELVEISGP